MAGLASELEAAKERLAEAEGLLLEAQEHTSILHGAQRDSQQHIEGLQVHTPLLWHCDRAVHQNYTPQAAVHVPFA